MEYVDKEQVVQLPANATEAAMSRGVPTGGLEVTEYNRPFRAKMWKKAYEESLPSSQRVVEQGDGICLCPSFGECPRAAVLHTNPKCQFCYGLTSRYFPRGKMYRYYPCDDGWEGLRHIAIEMRNVAVEEKAEATVGPPHD